jgi:hypothetical protein
MCEGKEARSRPRDGLMAQCIASGGFGFGVLVVPGGDATRGCARAGRCEAPRGCERDKAKLHGRLSDLKTARLILRRLCLQRAKVTRAGAQPTHHRLLERRAWTVNNGPRLPQASD